MGTILGPLQFSTGCNIICDTVTVTFANVDATTCCPIVQNCGSILELLVTINLSVL